MQFRIYQFMPGEAVYNRADELQGRPAQRLRIERVASSPNTHEYVCTVNDRVTVRPIAGGRAWCARPENLIYCGYCPDCKQPAIDQAGALVCPNCHAPAIAEPPPDRVAALVYCPDMLFSAQRTREMLLTGCNGHKAVYEVDLRFNMARWLMIARIGCPPWAVPDHDVLFNQRFLELALRDDIEGCRLAIIDGLARAISPEALDAIHAGFDDDEPDTLPPVASLYWQQPADDMQPDGADDLTAWLDRQFDRGAA